jgi:hypothetical protein
MQKVECPGLNIKPPAIRLRRVKIRGLKEIKGVAIWGGEGYNIKFALGRQCG